MALASFCIPFEGRYPAEVEGLYGLRLSRL